MVVSLNSRLESNKEEEAERYLELADLRIEGGHLGLILHELLDLLLVARLRTAVARFQASLVLIKILSRPEREPDFQAAPGCWPAYRRRPISGLPRTNQRIF